MNRRAWKKVEGAPHGRLFYLWMVFFSALGVAFFCYISVGNSTELGWVWRVAYGARAPLFLLGMLQALERLVLPERAAARSGTLTEGVKLGILIGRWLTIAVSLGGFVVVSVVSFFVQGDAKGRLRRPEAADPVDDPVVLLSGGSCRGDDVLSGDVDQRVAAWSEGRKRRAGEAAYLVALAVPRAEVTVVQAGQVRGDYNLKGRLEPTCIERTD